MSKNVTLKNAADLLGYLESKALTHNVYKFYSTEDRVENIIKDKSLFLSDGVHWNDCEDRTRLNNDDTKRSFAICFSFSLSESVAMWMLYGGMNKKGVMINFNKNAVIDSYNDNQAIELGYFKNGEFVSRKILSRNEYTIKMVDILYYSDKSEKDGSAFYRLKRSDEVRDVADIDDFINLKQCIKKYPWSYENECRLIITIDKQLIGGEKINTVKFPLSSSISRKEIAGRIILSPNYIGDKDWAGSKLKGKIDWDLCKTCKPCEKYIFCKQCDAWGKYSNDLSNK